MITSFLITPHFFFFLFLKLRGKESQGNAFWKFNDLLIANGHFVTKLKNYIAHTLATMGPANISDNQFTWELLKYESRKFSMEFFSPKI